MSLTSKAGWAWLFQRVTAVYLAFFLLLHLLHLGSAEGAGLESIAALPGGSWLWWLVYLLFVPSAVFHWLYGIYAIFLDYNPAREMAKLAALLFLVLGSVLTLMGLWTMVRL